MRAHIRNQKIVAYTVMSLGSPKQVQTVDLMLAEGWQPLGGATAGDNSHNPFQVLVKYEEDE